MWSSSREKELLKALLNVSLFCLCRSIVARITWEWEEIQREGGEAKWGKTERKKDGLLIRHVGSKYIYSFFIFYEMKGRICSLSCELQHDVKVSCVMFPAESVMQFKRSKVQKMERSRKLHFLWLIWEQRHGLWRAVWTDHTPHGWQQQWQHSLKDLSGSLYMTMFHYLF